MSSKLAVTDVIRSRRSWRTFVPELLDPSIQKKLEAMLAEKHIGPFEGSVRFRLLELPEDQIRSSRRIGTYGMIKDARYFILGAAQRGNHALENYGYLFEKIILAATEMGLGTCWLGGALHRDEISQTLEATEGEYIPAISPVGYPTEQRDFRDRMIRWSAGSHARKNWHELFFYHDFTTPLRRDDLPDYDEPLEMVRLAPSASNRQPWRVVKEKGRPWFHFYMKKNPLYGKFAHAVLGAENIQRLDMGIAMCHFALTAGERGLKGRWIVSQPQHIELPTQTEYSVSWIEE